MRKLWLVMSQGKTDSTCVMSDTVVDTDVMPPAGAWVWINEDAPRRLTRVWFRRELVLAGPAAGASLTLSARTRYRLRVNGTPVGTGPARSYPEFREADTYDLTPHLKAGANSIEVEVLHVDFATFHHLAEPAGFIAWGEVTESSGARHDLATPGAWQGRRHRGVAADAPRLSFAQDPVDVVDLLAEAPGSNGWHAPVAAAAGVTPELKPRAIPALTRLPLAAVGLQQAAVADAEVMFGTRVVADAPTPDKIHGFAGAARGWLYSPREQTVHFGSWWGHYWINGSPVTKGDDASRPLRQSMDVKLAAGWNRIAASGEMCFGYWEFCLAWPRAAGLTLRTAPREDAPAGVELAGPFARTALNAAQAALMAGGEISGLSWRVAPGNAAGGSPLRRLAWAQPATPGPAKLPLSMPTGTPTLLAADMGQSVLGSITLDVDAPAGTVVSVGHVEQLTPAGRPDYAKAVVMYSADCFVLAAGRQRIETFAPRGFRHLELLVEGHMAPVTVHGVGVVETRYPYSFTGTFACSDENFNRLWTFGRRTLELCSEDALTDCPWRERTLYGGDLLAEMGATAALTRDLRLVRRSLDVFLQSFNPTTGWLQSLAPMDRDRPSLADYPLLVAVGTAWLVRLTNDAAFARRAWPVFQGMARALGAMRRPDGLYVPHTSAFIDHRRRVTAGPTAAFNAAVVAGLRAMAEVGRRAGNAAGAAPLEVSAAALESRLSAAYFDEPAGLFRDLPPGGGVRGTEGSPAIVWPLLFAPSTRGLAPAVLPGLRRILDGFTPEQEAQSVSPYQMFYLLALLRTLGEAELAETTIRRVYAKMLTHPTGTLWEHAGPDQSLVHAWSCAVNDYFATAVLGVRLGFEGAGELAAIHVRPCAAMLTWARGVVPHPLGEVAVEWQREGERLRVSVRAPAGVPVEVAPAGPLATLDCTVVLGDAKPVSP